MEKDFVPKKTITVQLPLDIMEQFRKLCESLNLSKTKTVEKMITEAYDALFTK